MSSLEISPRNYAVSQLRHVTVIPLLPHDCIVGLIKLLELQRIYVWLLCSTIHYQTKEPRWFYSISDIFEKYQSCYRVVYQYRTVNRHEGADAFLLMCQSAFGAETRLAIPRAFSARKVTLLFRVINPEGWVERRSLYWVSGSLKQWLRCLIWLFTNVMTWNSFLSPPWESVSFMENHRLNWIFVLWGDKWSDIN